MPHGVSMQLACELVILIPGDECKTLLKSSISVWLESETGMVELVVYY